MPFAADPVVQTRVLTLSGQTSPLSVSFTSSVKAGSTLVIAGCAITSSDTATLLGTPSGGGATWSAAINTRTSGASSPNVFVAVGQNSSAGAATISLPFTAGGGSATDFRVSGVMLEIEGGMASDVVDKIVTGTASATASTSTAATGTLAQADQFLVLVAGGWFGLPINPAGYTSRWTQQNGPFIGVQVSTRLVSATTSVTGTVAHEVGGDTSAILVTLKGSPAVSFYVEFEFPALQLPSAEGGIEGMMWRNVEPFSTSGGTTGYTYHTAAQIEVDSGTKPGDATGRLLRVTGGLPPGIALGDTMRGIFRKTGGVTKGSVAVIPGTVKTV